ncbi:MAG: adenylate kinase [Fimbriimonadaceae bacterium]|nr:adenylate kinase [Fimbriimonadaceae bacterium]
MPFRLILIGPPGVGKGTQAALLEEHLKVKPLSSGVIFRQEIEADTDLGQLAKSYIDRGELVPNGVTIQMMIKRLRSDDVRRNGFVLDGFPRTVRQAEALDVELQNEQVVLDRVILLSVSDEVVVRRLAGRMGCTKCGEIYHSTNKPPAREGLCDKCNSQLLVRKDDNPETIRERLRIFREETAPVAEYYRAQGLLKDVDAAGDAVDVYALCTEGLVS